MHRDSDDAYIICIVTLMMLILYALCLWWCLYYMHCDSDNAYIIRIVTLMILIFYTLWLWWCLYYTHCDSDDAYIIHIVTLMMLILYKLWLWWCLYHTHCDSDDAYCRGTLSTSKIYKFILTEDSRVRSLQLKWPSKTIKQHGGIKAFTSIKQNKYLLLLLNIG